MPTFLFDKIVFGPVKSRRLGVSLGINLLPVDGKLCNFDCIYCECGWNDSGKKHGSLPKRSEVKQALSERLLIMTEEGTLPDVITFAGNGEPCMHPEFEGIIDDTIELRNSYCPMARIAVLSNSTLIHKENVRRALFKVDQNILKLDTVNEKSFHLINKPAPGLKPEKIIDDLKSFEGKIIIQTLFFRGYFDNEKIDNTTESELSGLIDAYHNISPEKIMIYTFERDTAAEGLTKISLPELNRIRDRLVAEGFEVEVSA